MRLSNCGFGGDTTLARNETLDTGRDRNGRLVSITSTGKTSSPIVVAAAFWWCVSLWLFLRHGQTDFIISVSTFMASVVGLLAWRGRLQPAIVIWMVGGWTVCWCLLPEYSITPSDRLALIWSASRNCFGGTTLMAITAVMAGVVSTAFADFRNR
jgi:hypothetical protein